MVESLGKVGAATFPSQVAAENYLYALPDGYEGRTLFTDSRRWMVVYRFRGM